VPPARSVIVPAHNEEALLGESLAAIVDGLRARDVAFEVLVVENGSTDGTVAVADAAVARLPEVAVTSLATADYGEALRAGILQATGDVVVMFDVDYYDLDFYDRAVAALDAPGGPAIVVGSKRAPGTHDERPWPRRAVTAGFATLLRLGFGLSVSDTHGMKAMRRAAVVDLARACRSRADLFDTELVLRAERAGLGVAELPVTVRELRPSRTPILRRALRTVVGLVRLRVLLSRDAKRRDG
jgi:glycosyltransferase involved in cell wall biosynthesis